MPLSDTTTITTNNDKLKHRLAALINSVVPVLFQQPVLIQWYMYSIRLNSASRFNSVVPVLIQQATLIPLYYVVCMC
jgi:hypothetical protein